MAALKVGAEDAWRLVAYFAQKANCDACDDNGPVLAATAVGALVGGIIGGTIAYLPHQSSRNQSRTITHMAIVRLPLSLKSTKKRMLE